MKSITDPTFQYTPSVETDLRKTFAKVRRRLKEEAAERERAEAEAKSKVAQIKKGAK